MTIKIIANDIEIDGIKVARLLDMNASMREELESMVEEMNRKGRIATIPDEQIEDAYNSGKSDGYAEGREDANSD
jgi:flagellar biosynthesis/type III secretory pathway protein FliH